MKNNTRKITLEFALVLGVVIILSLVLSWGILYVIKSVSPKTDTIAIEPINVIDEVAAVYVGYVPSPALKQKCFDDYIIYCSKYDIPEMTYKQFIKHWLLELNKTK